MTDDQLIAQVRGDAEPVAWIYDFPNPDNRDEVIPNWVTQDPSEIEDAKGFNVRPLYDPPSPAVVRQLVEAKACIHSAKLCEFNSMSSRHEMMRLMDEAISMLEAALAAVRGKKSPHPLPKATGGSNADPVAYIGTDGSLNWLKKPEVLYSKAVPLYTYNPLGENDDIN
jgi:L-alanine-DL-glutamate epimerase-like enolase superfamily enzyme